MLQIINYRNAVYHHFLVAVCLIISLGCGANTNTGAYYNTKPIILRLFSLIGLQKRIRTLIAQYTLSLEHPIRDAEGAGCSQGDSGANVLRREI